MKKAVVLGASGGMGYAIVKELAERGIAITAFARNEKKLQRLFIHEPQVTIMAGDVFQLDELTAAAKDVDVIFQAVSIPYIQWEEKLMLMMKNIVATAKVQSAKLAIVDNIYAYGNAGKNISETIEKKPCSKKGRIRLDVENMIKQSMVPYIIAHFPDFYGPNAENTILQVTLENIAQDKRAIFVGKQNIEREFIYTPDGAKALVQLALQNEAYGENWNIPGAGVITGEEINYQKKVATISKKMVEFLGLFNRNMREVAEMFYLNETPVTLCGKKYEARIGPIPKTSYRDGLRHTIENCKQKKSIPLA